MHPPIFTVEEFSELFAHPYVFLIKIPCKHKYCMAFYLTSCIDEILIYYSLSMALQFHKNL